VDELPDPPAAGWAAAVEAVPGDAVEDGADPWSRVSVVEVGRDGVLTVGVVTAGVVRVGVVSFGVVRVGVVRVGVLTVGVVTGPTVIVGTVTDGTVSDGVLTVGTDTVGSLIEVPPPSASATAGTAERTSATHPARIASLKRFIGPAACPIAHRSAFPTRNGQPQGTPAGSFSMPVWTD
jgi:hypothetical protein